MSTNPDDIRGLDPEDSGQVLGMIRDWGQCNAIELGVTLPDGTKKHVSTAALIEWYESGGSGSTGMFVYDGNSVVPSATWNITHTLNNKYPIVAIFDMNGSKIGGSFEDYANSTETTITLNFPKAITGIAVLVGGAVGGTDPSASMRNVTPDESIIGTYKDPDDGITYDLYRRVISFITSADGSSIDIQLGFSPKKIWVTRGNLYGKSNSDQQDGTVFSYPLLYTNSQYLMEFMARRIDDKIRIRSMGFTSLPGDIWVEYTKNA